MVEKEETRKLQLTGGATYTISMPKDWITEMNLKKGDALVLTRKDDGTILISPRSTRKPDRARLAIVNVSIKDEIDTIIRKIVSLYLVGYETIQIRREDREITSTLRNSIQNFTRRMLVGTEIVSDSPRELTLQVLLSSPELSVKSALRRISFISAAMHEDVIRALKDDDKKTAEEIIATDDEVDRFNHYIIRQLKSAIQDKSPLKEIGLTTPREILGYRLITKSIERMADHAVNVAKEILELKERINPETIEKISEMSSSANSVFTEAIEALFKQDFQLADKVVEEAKKTTFMEKDVIRTILKKAEREAPSLRLITESIRRTAEYASDIAEIVQNLTIESILVPQE